MRVSEIDSKNFSKWFSIGVGGSEKLFQCDECYQVWRNKVKKRENWPKVKPLLLGLCIGISLKLVTKLFFPEIDKKISDNPKMFFALVILLFIILIILGPILEISRYETRKSKKKKEKSNH